jgi:uncharacterized repeat protein (TIGR03803 family)
MNFESNSRHIIMLAFFLFRVFPLFCVVEFVLPISGASAAPVAQSAIHSFNGIDGSEPKARLIQGTDGNFYGTTSTGGTANSGTVFKMTPAGTVTTLHSFTAGTDGAAPTAGLIQASDGNFYGTLDSGGAHSLGYIYKLTPAGVFSTLFSFSGTDGTGPKGELTQGTDGNLYGVTGFVLSGTCLSSVTPVPDCGTVFKISLAGVISTFHIFSSGVDGQNPVGGLIQGLDGSFYGMTFNGLGTVFKITPAGVFSTLHQFAGGVADGQEPFGGLVQLADGTLYGATAFAGANGAGTIFKMAPDGTGFSLAHSFESIDSVTILFESRTRHLLLGSDGNLYGTTPLAPASGAGLPPNSGAVYQLTPAGVFSRIFIFPTSPGDVPPTPTGALPKAGLAQGSDGNLYGTSSCGGAGDTAPICSKPSGTVFKLAAGLPSTSPTVAVALDKTSITLGSSATLTWSSSNVTSCAASNAWTGSQPNSGTQTVAPTAAGTFTYTLTCNGSSSAANGSATLMVTAPGGGSGGSSGGGGGGGCAMAVGARFDPILLFLVLVAFARVRYEYSKAA